MIDDYVEYILFIIGYIIFLFSLGAIVYKLSIREQILFHTGEFSLYLELLFLCVGILMCVISYIYLKKQEDEQYDRNKKR